MNSNSDGKKSEQLVWHPLVDAINSTDISYFPRNSNNERVDPTEFSEDINRILDGLVFKDLEEAKLRLSLVQESYKEVKSATEYQDNKTVRLLTILAFLTAAAGTVFGKFVDLYPANISRELWQQFIVGSSYILFGSYFFMIATGALVSFYSMQTRFIFNERSDKMTDRVKSVLFFKYIYSTKPDAWAKTFTPPTLDLYKIYIKHYVLETYLIAVKTGNKVRYIQPAQDMLQASIKVLIVWIVTLFLVVALVPRQNSPQVQLPTVQKSI